MTKTGKRFKARGIPAFLMATWLCACLLMPLRAAAIREDGRYTFIWMSDTQHYAADHPEILTAMAEWCVAQKDALDIRYVIHTGDIVNSYRDTRQWKNASKALSLLTGHIPLFITAGNHDVGSWSNYENFLKWFGGRKFSRLETFGGYYFDGKGRYDLLDAGGERWLLLTMGYGMSDKSIAWMNKVLQQYPDRTAILCVHSYTYGLGLLTPEGDKFYKQVVVPNPNVRLVLCGHSHMVYHNSVKIDDDGDGVTDRTVYQLLANYQEEEKGGQGYLCILDIDPVTGGLSVSTYSPYLDDYNMSLINLGFEEFTVKLQMNE